MVQPIYFVTCIKRPIEIKWKGWSDHSPGAPHSLERLGRSSKKTIIKVKRPLQGNQITTHNVASFLSLSLPLPHVHTSRNSQNGCTAASINRKEKY